MNLAITGPTSGIGTETVKALHTKFEKIFLLARNEGKCQELIESLSLKGAKEKFEFIHLDLANLSSVHQAAEYLLEKKLPIHVLINNAGGIFPEKLKTKDGLEMTFSVNHLGHFLLTNKILPLLEKAQGARVINVSSEAHKAAKPDFEDLQVTKSYSSFPVYANAKLFNILFTKSLAERYADKHITSYALHPGVVKTNFGNDFSGIFKWLIKLAQPFMISAEKGAETSVFLSLAEGVEKKSGGYFKKSKESKPSQIANSRKYRETLWEKSNEIIGTI
ncbi:SDR family oxidoreductase [Pleomorphovibrio marinus]|uniref:SDR family oxidoreductase n=1 Tax=Pleomorphovibrio marinus TaxID=2164132 RepID=UPI000E0A1490|nr:SDR family oxidoreductase [Pleomorphovibrio marinus]